MEGLLDFINSQSESVIINIGRKMPDINFAFIMGNIHVYSFHSKEQMDIYGKDDIYIWYDVDNLSNVHVSCHFYSELEYLYLDTVPIINYKNYIRKEKIKKLCSL